MIRQRTIRFFVIFLIAIATIVLTVAYPLSEKVSSAPGVGEADQAADAIYTNARVWTVNPDQEWAEAFAVKDGKFVAVGSAEEVAALAGDGTETIDLEGDMVLPGFHDMHVHADNMYRMSMLEGEYVLLPGDAGPDEAAALIRAFAESRPDLPYIPGFNLGAELFDNNEATAEWLDTAVSDRPAYIITATGHEGVMNTLALEQSGIDADTPDPRNGIISRNPETGEATGFVKENAMGFYISPFMPRVDTAEHVAGFRTVLQDYPSLGITSIRIPMTELDENVALHELATTEGLPIRVSSAWAFDSTGQAARSLDDVAAEIAQFKELTAPRFDPAYVKIFMDGIPTETASMLEPYVTVGGVDELFEPDTAAMVDPIMGGDPGDRGLLFWDVERLANTIVRLEEMGMRGMMFHSVGDRATQVALDAMEIARDRLGGLNGRYHLAHSFILSDEDLARLAELDLTAEFSPVVWFPNPMNDTFNSMVGPERAARVFPMRSAIDAGARIVLASDAPLYYEPPLSALESAVTRANPHTGGPQDAAGAQAITLEEAIAAHTINAAYMAFAEDKVGSIEPGKFADFVVLDRDLFAIPIEDVSEAQVLATVVEGTVVFNRDGAVDDQDVGRQIDPATYYDLHPINVAEEDLPELDELYCSDGILFVHKN